MDKNVATRLKTKTTSVTVIGAGVMGLTTALLAQKKGYHVSIYTDKPTSQTTSAKAAASFKPGGVVYNDLAHKTVQLSWDGFGRILHEYDPAVTGVRMHTLWEASSHMKAPARHLEIMKNVKILDAPHVPGGYALGWRYETYFVDTSLYMPWLIKVFTSKGGEIHMLENKLTSPDQFQQMPGEIIFNCTGMGARELVNDPLMRPIKGQIAIIKPLPDMDWTINADGFYVYPRSKDTVLGGTTEWDVDDETVDTEAIHLIIEKNRRILPHLQLEDIITTYAGLRPYRDESIRIEAEIFGEKKVIHNYGHGGSGITMSWGSAELAVGLI